MIKRIMVPVDGSSFSERASEFSVYLSKTLNAKLVAIHVIKVGATKKLDSENVGKRKLKQAEICFGPIKEKALKNSIEIETKIIVSRKIADTILEEAMDGEYDLIVIGSHGLSGLRKLVLGSVTEEVLKKSSIPVLVVR